MQRIAITEDEVLGIVLVDGVVMNAIPLLADQPHERVRVFQLLAAIDVAVEYPLLANVAPILNGHADDESFAPDEAACRTVYGEQLEVVVPRVRMNAVFTAATEVALYARTESMIPRQWPPKEEYTSPATRSAVKTARLNDRVVT